MIKQAKLNQLKVAGTITLFCFSFSLPAATQIVPDASLPTNSTVTTDENNSIIRGGTQAGSNLFHSFEQFSLPAGGTAYFNNFTEIQNIFSRVTGGSASNIDGILRANGTANLFLLNPNGIVFGANAKLDIGGSFLGSTANSIKFVDGLEFSATAPSPTPLLTVSVPIGLKFGSNPGKIRVQGTGHNLIGLPFSPVVGLNNSSGFSVQPGKTLALLGGDITIDGGVLKAPGGNVELGSVEDGVVSLSTTPAGWNFSYRDVASFKDINLFQRALADASGFGGSIQVQGRNISLTNGSVILIQNQGSQPGGDLRVNASESIKVSGTDSVAKIAGSLRNETLGTGNAGDVAVSAKNLVVQDGGQINNFTFSTAKSGNTLINASDVKVIGFSPLTPELTRACLQT